MISSPQFTGLQRFNTPQIPPFFLSLSRAPPHVRLRTGLLRFFCSSASPGAITPPSCSSLGSRVLLSLFLPFRLVIGKKKGRHTNPSWYFFSIYLRIYFIFWLWWVFMVALRLSLLVAQSSGGLFVGAELTSH